MILGLIAGRWLREAAPQIPVKKLLVTGLTGITTGVLLHVTHICPVVKRIWTPSWTLFSGGACFLLLAAFCWAIEMKQQKRRASPLVVVGMNFIAAYCIAHFMQEFLVSNFRTHLGPHFFEFLGTGLQPLLEGSAVLFSYWLVLFRMYRSKLFLKI